MYTATVKLRLRECDRQRLEKSFFALQHVHNVMAKRANKLLIRIRHDHACQDMLKEYMELKKKARPAKGDERRMKELGKALKAVREETGLSKGGFEKYRKAQQHRYSHLLTSQQVQKEAERVWIGAQKALFGNGKKVAFKKALDITTIGGKSKKNGARFDAGRNMVMFLGMELPLKVPKNDAWLEEALKGNVKYCELKREMFPAGWHYYAVLCFGGTSPRKEKNACSLGRGTMGTDPGVSTMAAASDGGLLLRELAPESGKYDKRIRKLQQKMEASKRAANPERYNDDGTYRKGSKGRFRYSKSYRRLRRQLRAQYRKKAAYVKQDANLLAKEMCGMAGVVYCEKMNFAALAKRSKKAGRQDRESNVKQKDGTVKQVRKYRRKKRFGRSVQGRSPGLYVATLKKKVESAGGQFIEIDPWKYKASQYDHAKDEYVKVPLRQREKDVGGAKVQRDLYSAFLLQNPDSTMERPDREKCSRKFAKFIGRHDALIKRMKDEGASMRQCFGF